MFKQACVGSREEQYSKYVNVVLIERKISIHKANKKKQLPLFKRRHFTTTISKAKQQFQQMKKTAISSASCSLVHKFVNTRLVEVFAHENHPWPPALSLHGKLRLTSTKHELLHYI